MLYKKEGYKMKKIVLFLLLMASTANADIYHWTDENGVRHWSNKKPVVTVDVNITEEIPATIEPYKDPTPTYYTPTTTYDDDYTVGFGMSNRLRNYFYRKQGYISGHGNKQYGGHNNRGHRYNNKRHR